MKVLSFPAKFPSESLPYTINFSDMLQFGESINGASVSATSNDAQDTNASDIIYGDPSYTETEVTQTISGGKAGVTYSIFVIVTADNHHNYAKCFQLAVLPEDSTA